MNRATKRLSALTIVVILLTACEAEDREEPDPVRTSPADTNGLILNAEGSAPLAELTADGCFATVTFLYRVSGSPDLVADADGQELEIKVVAIPSGAPLDGTTQKTTIADGTGKFELRAGPIERGGTQVQWQGQVQRLGDTVVPEGQATFGKGATAQTGFVCT